MEEKKLCDETCTCGCQEGKECTCNEKEGTCTCGCEEGKCTCDENCTCGCQDNHTGCNCSK